MTPAISALRLPPASSPSSASTSSTSSSTGGSIMDQRRANAQRNDFTSVRGITMRKSVISVDCHCHRAGSALHVCLCRKGRRARYHAAFRGKVLRDDENKPLVYAPGLHFKIPVYRIGERCWMRVFRPWTTRLTVSRYQKRRKDLIVDFHIK